MKFSQFALAGLAAVLSLGLAWPTMAGETGASSSEVVANPFVGTCERWQNTAIPLQRPFIKDAGYAVVATLPELSDLADSSEAPHKSPFILCESGHNIGTPHTTHDSIRQLGKGNYSHWKNGGLFFSSSDGSDPNTNGRQYTLVFNPEHPYRKKLQDMVGACQGWKSSEIVLKPPFSKEQGYAYRTVRPELKELGDSNDAPRHSPYVLCEDGVKIGSPHTEHHIIRELGHGSFSHWGETIRFSSSDNSDPNTNGHQYSLVRSPE
jgi:pectate lyase